MPPPYKPSPHGEGGPRQRCSGAFVCSITAPLFLLYFPLSFIPCLPYLFPRIVIPSAAEGSLLHCRHRQACALTQTTPWCFLFRLSLAHGLPPCKKDPSTSALMTRKKDGMSHIVFHTATWIHPAPLARPFSKGLLVSLL